MFEYLNEQRHALLSAKYERPLSEAEEKRLENLQQVIAFLCPRATAKDFQRLREMLEDV